MSCPDCFTGSVHDGDPKGKVTKVYGLDAYVSEPTGKPVKGVIVIIPDAFGWEFVNSRILADHYADKGGFKVYLPDFMNGHAAPVAMLERMKSFFTASNIFAKFFHLSIALRHYFPFAIHNSFDKTFPIVKAFFDQLRKEEGATLPIGAAGFCWGGKHTFLLANTEDNATADGKPLIDAGFAGHPSRLKIPGDIEPVSVPISIAVGDKDNQISVPQAEQIRKILEAKPPATKGEIRVYEGAGHGFCIRGELKENKELARQANEAEDQCMAWFNAKFNIS